MTVYTVFGQAATGSSLVTDSADYTLGMQFILSQAATLTGIWFYSAPGATIRPSACCLYQVTGAGAGSQVAGSVNSSPSWSGAAGSGWIRCAYPSGPALSSGVSYKVAVQSGGGSNWYSITSAYWSSGAGSSGITSGIITAVNNAAGDGGQDTFVTPSAALTYPATAFNASNYWTDVEVTSTPQVAAARSTPAVTAPDTSAATVTDPRDGTASVTAAVSVPSVT